MADPRKPGVPGFWVAGASFVAIALVAAGTFVALRNRGDAATPAPPGAGASSPANRSGNGSGAATASEADGATAAHFFGAGTGGSPNEDLRPLKGMFATECKYSHSSNDDPIVFPGEQGAAHHHDFFGNPTTDFTSTIDSLLGAGRTTCRMKSDTAAYWAPALARDGVWIQPVSSDAYYRVAPSLDRSKVVPYPKGLMMISGDGHATAPQSLDIVAWACDRSLRISASLPSCPEGSQLTMRVTFQDCWDGQHTDSDDHRAHVAYSGPAGCPASHPVPMPQLTFVVHYPVSGPTDSLTLSPGSLLGGHADFVNTWDPEGLKNEINQCLVRNVVCDPPGGTGGSPPTF